MYKLSTFYLKSGAWVDHLVECAPIYRGVLLDAAAAGSTPTCGPLLHVIPPLSLSRLSCLHLSYINKGLKCPKKIIFKIINYLNKEQVHRHYNARQKNKTTYLGHFQCLASPQPCSGLLLLHYNSSLYSSFSISN